MKTYSNYIKNNHSRIDEGFFAWLGRLLKDLFSDDTTEETKTYTNKALQNVKNNQPKANNAITDLLKTVNKDKADEFLEKIDKTISELIEKKTITEDDAVKLRLTVLSIAIRLKNDEKKTDDVKKLKDEFDKLTKENIKIAKEVSKDIQDEKLPEDNKQKEEKVDKEVQHELDKEEENIEKLPDGQNNNEDDFTLEKAAEYYNNFCKQYDSLKRSYYGIDKDGNKKDGLSPQELMIDKKQKSQNSSNAVNEFGTNMMRLCNDLIEKILGVKKLCDSKKDNEYSKYADKLLELSKTIKELPQIVKQDYDKPEEKSKWEGDTFKNDTTDEPTDNSILKVYNEHKDIISKLDSKLKDVDLDEIKQQVTKYYTDNLKDIEDPDIYYALYLLKLGQVITDNKQQTETLINSIYSKISGSSK